MANDILFPQNTTSTPRIKVVRFTYADWGGDKDDRKSTEGFVFILKGASTSWSSKKEQVVALSTREAKYIVVAMLHG